jgi:hypothetical protein
VSLADQRRKKIREEMEAYDSSEDDDGGGGGTKKARSEAAKPSSGSSSGSSSSDASSGDEGDEGHKVGSSCHSHPSPRLLSRHFAAGWVASSIFAAEVAVLLAWLAQIWNLLVAQLIIKGRQVTDDAF